MRPKPNSASTRSGTVCRHRSRTSLVSSAERVGLAEPLYVLADTQKLLLSAEIHERDWKLLSITPGQTLEVRTPAFPGESFSAIVKRIGSERLRGNTLRPLDRGDR